MYINYNWQIGKNLDLIGLKTKCKMDIYKFPFDKQLCLIKIGSRSLVNSIISINYKEFWNEFNPSGYVNNSMWSITSQSVQVINTTRISDIYQTSDTHFILLCHYKKKN